MMGNPALKKNVNRNRWRSIIAIFIFVFLIVASLKGFIKSDISSTALEKSKWDSNSSFAVTLLGSSNNLFIFQKDPKRVIVLSLGQNFNLGENSKEAVKNISILFGAPIDNYIKYKNQSIAKYEDYKKIYSKFISWTTPLLIITSGWGGSNMNTNVSRIDALRLWWQLKGIGVNSLIAANLPALSGGSNFGENKKVLSANTQEFNRSIAKYMENLKIVNENYQINIINASGEFSVSRLANSFITSVGGSVASISGDSNIVSKCILKAGRQSYTANYLAKIFDCDIKDASQDADSSQITLVLGNDFARRYFE